MGHFSFFAGLCTVLKFFIATNFSFTLGFCKIFFNLENFLPLFSALKFFVKNFCKKISVLYQNWRLDRMNIKIGDWIG